MSTMPGLASKGEKGKSKFQSLDINNLYRVSLGESVEKQQQKNTLSLKHGMQSLGKVPSARRPPANLPSLKSEHSGSDTAVSLVPSNGPGWGKQETTSSPTPTTNASNPPVNTPNMNTPQISAHQAAIALPVTTTIPPPSKPHHATMVPATGDKSWSSVMTGSDPVPHPPPYQSPQFQHEFPSLSAGDGVPVRTGTDTQYGPGPSLRPQTEGSWMQGGSRGAPDPVPRSSSAPLGAPPQLSAQVGQPLPPQYRGFVPPFMYRGNNNFPANGHGTPPIATQPPTAAGTGAGNRNRSDPRNQKSSDQEELHRPIIKEEELSGMDNLTGDMGWALHDDIDYNQKLAFSDDESKPDRESRNQLMRSQKDPDKTDNHSQDSNDHKIWSGRSSSMSSQPPSRGRQEDDELSAQHRRHQQEVASAIERAKQRKEEEEKKYLESKQNAAKKLQKLNERTCKIKRDKECDESIGTINPSSIPPQTIAPVPILLPEWEREREREARPKSESEEKPLPKQAIRESGQSDFRQMTQIEGRTGFARKDTRGSDKDQSAPPSFSRQFQINLPPRFQKQQQLNATVSTQPSMPFTYDSRWSQGGNSKTSPNNRKNRTDGEEKDPREEDRFRRNDDHFRHRQYSDSGRKSSNENRYEEYKQDHDFKKDNKEEDKRGERPRDRHDVKSDLYDSLTISRQNSDEWRNERRIDRYERPPRTDSRDTRGSRDSRDSNRHSEPREYIGSWPETNFDDAYEEKKKEHRMQVPGPITKEKIEADDLRSEKRNLTQLKRGLLPEKKVDKRDEKTPEIENEDLWSARRNKESLDGPRAWADAISPSTVAPENPKFMESEKKSTEMAKNVDDEEKDKFVDKDLEDKRSHGTNRGRMESQGNRNQGWGGGGSGMVYRTSWSKKGSSVRGGGPRGGQRPPSSKSNDWQGTESEGSADDNLTSGENAQERSPKPIKKFDKDDRDKGKDFKSEKNVAGERKNEKGHREFVPRGEPSRHGRGGSTFRGGGRGGCKRIDGYGPPPLKSPFSHNDDKDKKNEGDSSENVSDDKSKMAGLGMKDICDRKFDDRNKNRKIDPRRSKRNEGDVSDNSDDASKDKMRKNLKGPIRQPMTSNQRRGGMVAPPRLLSEKRSFGGPSRNEPPNRQNSSGSLRSNQSKDIKDKDIITTVTVTLPDMSLKQKDEPENPEVDAEGSLQSDSDGFQEVKSKKTGKSERPKLEEKPKPPISKVEKDLKNERKGKTPSQLSQQQIANIPSLMATPVNPPPNMPQPQAKGQFERPRQNKLPPRLVKQRENNRLHKAQMQQGMCDVNDMNKVNQGMYGLKDGGGVVSGNISNAWEKPLTAQMRANIDQDNMLSVGMDSCKMLEQSQVHCQNNSTGEDKTVLDGSKPLNTIIFENTNFKSAPGCRMRNEKPRCNKIEDNIDGSAVLSNFNKPIGELLNKNDKTDMQIQLAFNKEDTADMKLDFFESEISHLTDDKTSKSIGLPRTMHTITSSNTTISPSTADALNIKIQSVKKVWETMATVIEHGGVGQDDGNSFSSSFGPDPNGLDPTATFSKGTDTPDDNHEVYSPSPNNQIASNSTTNVCKVKPTQQVAGSAGQAVLSTGTHQQHSAMVGPGLMGHPLSPPPMQPVIGAGVGLGQAPQQFATSQHISYQASLAGSNQYGMPAIPSPPTVVYNSTQQLQAQTGLYGAFQIDQSQVINSQSRSQYSQYSYGLGQTASSPYSQSMYLQTGQPHAPPTAQAPPDLYTNMSNYRIPANGPFGQNQQLNNPTTVLISSTSNSLMSATVKPSNQQISAIGTKAGGVGQAYQQQSQQGQQLYMTYDPSIQANYLQNTGVLQRPGGPVQNNVVPGLQASALQPSSSYYSGSTGGQTGYFQQPGSSTLQSAQMPQHQAGYGLQGSVFGTPHNQSHTSAGMQNYGSHFLSTPMQLAAAMSAQQYRSAATLPNAAYMKGVGNQQITDQSGRSQQLKSPGSQQEVLSSVFNSGSQIPSPKSRQPCKQPPPQPSPTAQQKYLYSNVSNQQSGQTRYPAPIQRPVGNYQTLGSVQNNGNQKHRNTNNSGNRTTPRQYYTGQGGNLNSQNDKSDESKLNDNVVNAPNTPNPASAANIVPKTAVSSVNQTSDKTEVGKEENSAISKD